MTHTIDNEKEKEIVKRLRENGIQTYSISRLNAFNQCKFQYYNTYAKRDRGMSSIYGDLGTFTHEYIEKVYRGEIKDTSDFSRKLNTALFKAEMQDLTFPNENIEKSFMADMTHFCNNFKKLDGDFLLEKMYIAKFGEYYLMGYIDAIRTHDNGDTDIIDWKTSSWFSGDKLTHAGRQLILYKLGLEQNGIEIKSVMWNMLKYCYVCWVQKNKKIKKKRVNRGKLIKEMRKNFEKLLISNGVSELEVDAILDEAEKKNDFESLPQVIKDTYTIEDCLLEYNVTDDIIDETTNYVVNTIKEIESMDFNNEDEWKPLNIDKDNFYCNTLCGHRNTCPHLAKWKKDNPFKKIGF